jgi:hypothetical protein
MRFLSPPHGASLLTHQWASTRIAPIARRAHVSISRNPNRALVFAHQMASPDKWRDELVGLRLLPPHPKSTHHLLRPPTSPSWQLTILTT